MKEDIELKKITNKEKAKKYKFSKTNITDAQFHLTIK